MFKFILFIVVYTSACIAMDNSDTWGYASDDASDTSADSWSDESDTWPPSSQEFPKSIKPRIKQSPVSTRKNNSLIRVAIPIGNVSYETLEIESLGGIISIIDNGIIRYRIFIKANNINEKAIIAELKLGTLYVIFPAKAGSRVKDSDVELRDIIADNKELKRRKLARNKALKAQ